MSDDEEYIGALDSYSTEAKANIRARAQRMKRLIKHIEQNGKHMHKRKLLALFCIKEGVSKSTVYGYLEEYMDAEIVVAYGDHVMLIDQYIETRKKDTERLNELVDA